MSWTSHEDLLALAEAKHIREKQRFRERVREQRRDRELARRERLKAEIAQIQWQEDSCDDQLT